MGGEGVRDLGEAGERDMNMNKSLCKIFKELKNDCGL